MSMVILGILAIVGQVAVLPAVDALSCYVGGSLSMDDWYSKETCSEGDHYCIRIEVSNTAFPYYIMSCENAIARNKDTVNCEYDGGVSEYSDPYRNVYGTRYCCTGDFCNYPSNTGLKFKMFMVAVTFIGVVGLIIAGEMYFLRKRLQLQRAPAVKTLSKT